MEVATMIVGLLIGAAVPIVLSRIETKPGTLADRRRFDLDALMVKTPQLIYQRRRRDH